MIILKVVQIILSILIVMLVLLQSKSGGLSVSVSGAFTMYRAKRGIEKVIFIVTIVTAVLLAINSIALILTS